MSVLVDTCVWSLALRRRRASLSREERRLVAAFERLIRDGEVVLLGAVRQELLSGIASEPVWENLRVHLRAFPDLPVDEDVHEEASACANRCLRAGIASTTTDMLICAVARLFDLEVFTTDRDFDRLKGPLEIRLYSER